MSDSVRNVPTVTVRLDWPHIDKRCEAALQPFVLAGPRTVAQTANGIAAAVRVYLEEELEKHGLDSESEKVFHD